MSNIYRKYSDELESIEYKSEQNPENFKIHWGQRKLLISEIEFLTNNYEKYDENKEKLVVYAGSASGYHINYLKAMFPDLTYHLYDRTKHLVEEDEKTFIFSKYFTDEIARNYRGKNVLFISDIRTLNIRYLKDMTSEINRVQQDELIEEDLKMQVSWFEEMKPLSGLLKFRLPWFKEKTESIDGEVYFQPWAGGRSTETRIVPKAGTKILWDNKEYESILNYHNLVTRQKVLEDERDDCLGRYYDPIIEERILREYIKKFKAKIDYCTLSDSITLFLSRMQRKKIPISTKFLPNINKLKPVLD